MQAQGRRLTKTLYVQMDNCSRENKVILCYKMTSNCKSIHNQQIYFLFILWLKKCMPNKILTCSHIMPFCKQLLLFHSNNISYGFFLEQVLSGLLWIIGEPWIGTRSDIEFPHGGELTV